MQPSSPQVVHSLGAKRRVLVMVHGSQLGVLGSSRAKVRGLGAEWAGAGGHLRGAGAEGSAELRRFVFKQAVLECMLGALVVPFYPLFWGRIDCRKKGTLIIASPLEELVYENSCEAWGSQRRLDGLAGVSFFTFLGVGLKEEACHLG